MSTNKPSVWSSGSWDSPMDFRKKSQILYTKKLELAKKALGIRPKTCIINDLKYICQVQTDTII